MFDFQIDFVACGFVCCKYGSDGAACAEALDKDGIKKLDEVEASYVEEEQTNLFHFNPRMSYVPEDWAKAEPEFWQPKAAQ